MTAPMYLMDLDYFSRLMDDRRELLEVARSLGSADAMREAREELMRSATIQLTPSSPAEAEKGYSIDADGTAHIDIIGELTPRAKTDACGAYTAQALTEYGFIREVSRAADADDRVKRIVFHHNSPGGYLDGAFETADALRSLRKPTESHVGDMSASADYLLASQADRIVGRRSSRVGSIGVVLEVRDDTKALESRGVKRIIITSDDAPEKRPDLSTSEGKRIVLKDINDVHGLMAKYIAEGRRTTVENVGKNYGKGGVLIASKALAAGMIDEIVEVSRADARESQDLSDEKNALNVGNLGDCQIQQSTGVAGDTAAKAEYRPQEGVMDIRTLEKEHPDVFAQAVEIGVKRERERVATLRSYVEADPDNQKLAAVIGEAIAGGQTVEQMDARIQVAIRDGAKLAGENAPDIKTVADNDPLGEDDLKAAKMADMTPEEYRKYSRMAKEAR